MQRLQSLEHDQANAETRELLDQVKAAFGAIPNAVKVMANSPAVLESYLKFHGVLSKAVIGKKLLNQIKLATSEANACDYCSSILSAVGPANGLTAEDIMAGRKAESSDARTDAALKFANQVLDLRGKVSDEQLQKVRDAGFNDAELVEIVGSVILGSFTNFLNNVADTELDFPAAEPVSCHAGAACSA
ncbi:MAG: carboxymuconolactone decarboxylase family protein [Planctomycetaceae bacterium]